MADHGFVGGARSRVQALPTCFRGAALAWVVIAGRGEALRPLQVVSRPFTLLRPPRRGHVHPRADRLARCGLVRSLIGLGFATPAVGADQALARHGPRPPLPFVSSHDVTLR
jgi:hypothetical protein